GLQRYVDREGKSLGQIQLLHRAADDFAGIAPGSHDTVIINSVLQHFPTVEYLVKVLEGAVATVGPSGRIFVGDVRSLPLMESFALSVELFRAQDSMTVEQLLQGMRRRVAQDNELVVDPAFFLALQAHLPRIRRVDIHLKRGLLPNELSRFRYDVVLHVGEAAEPEEVPTGLDWKRGGMTVERLRQLLREERPERLRVTQIPNARMMDILAVREVLERDEAPATVGELRARLQQQPAPPAVHPEELWALAEELPYSVSLRWSGGEVDGAFELRLVRHGAAPARAVAAQELDPKPWRAYTNQPLLAALSRQLAPLLREYLAQSLPEYMVPSAILNLEALPRTPNGKVDRKALPAPLQSGLPRTGAVEAPRTPIEEMVAGIWAEVLGGGSFGPRDSFFELGGHSLLATQVISRVSRHFGVELPLHALFDKPTISGLAEHINASLRAARGVQPTPLQAAPRGQPLPASFAQQRLWFLQQLAPGSVSYNMPFALELKGKLEVPALEQALRHLVHRHESLRTTFTLKGDELFQVVGEAPSLPLPLVDLAGLAEPERQARLREQTEAQVRTPFELERGPLLRQCLVRLDEQEHVLLLTMHHIVSDGWSVGVLHRELGALYAAFVHGQGDPLPPLPVQYADYAVWHRRWVEGPVLEAQAEYWTETLAGAPELLELPTDHPRPAKQDFAGASVKVELDEALSAALKTLGQRHGATLHMTLLAGWAAVLARLSGQDEVVVGTPSANRGRSEIEGLIGFFVNTLPVRVDLSGAPTVAEALGRVKARALEAQANQDIPFEQVVERVQPARSLAHSPLFQVMFAWRNAPGGSLELPGLSLAPADATPHGTARFDLLLSLSEDGGRVVGGVEYATSLFERATVERWAGYLRRALEAMVADESQPVDRLPLLPEAERRLVVEEWNATGRAYPTDGLRVHDLFRAQAARTPHAVALSWRGERLTYAELEARANQIANALRRRGVGPEVRVGICLPRTPELVAAMLGVLGAGGAYVPLDPAYPRERLGYMAEDARVTLVITDSALADRLPEGAATLLLDRDRDAIAAESADAPESGVLPENLSHVIFTSGSTGRPKGVMIRHSSVVVLLHWLRENVTDEERSSVLFSTSINFDVSVAEVFGTLCWGGKLVIAENALELATLGEEVVYASMVPSAAAELLKSGGIPACVKTLNLGGEALPNALAQGLYALGTVEKVGNLYGP
ncbi:MAG: condensation domain-containing protein, partial [Longimicrobiaceae bacterium]